jgi:hypothetical protein
MDRGIPTEAVLAEMRQSDPPVHYLVGNAQGPAEQARARPRRQTLARGKTWRPGQALEPGPGSLPACPQCRSHQQGARHAPAPAQMAVGAAQAATDDGSHPRGAAHEAWRRAATGADRLAPLRRPRRRSRRLIHLHAQPRQAAQGPPSRGTLSPAHQSCRKRSRRPVGLLPPTRHRRGGLQNH